MTDFITAYGDNPPRWASPTTHAAKAGTGVRRGRNVGFHAVAACGRAVRHGTNAQPFNAESESACKVCARIVKPNQEKS
jgi:hypothetical protein